MTLIGLIKAYNRYKNQSNYSNNHRLYTMAKVNTQW